MTAAHLRAVRTQATAATDNLAITAYVNSGQVAATYKVEDMSMDVMVTFPKTFPLRTTEVVGGTRVGVSEGLWRKWLLSMAAVISLQVRGRAAPRGGGEGGGNDSVTHAVGVDAGASAWTGASRMGRSSMRS